ncbi:hypothetical protein PV328_007202, partial [Microctonus aethiopoides]
MPFQSAMMFHRDNRLDDAIKADCHQAPLISTNNNSSNSNNSDNSHSNNNSDNSNTNNNNNDININSSSNSNKSDSSNKQIIIMTHLCIHRILR